MIVSAERVGGILQVTVADNGPGVATDGAPHRGIGLRNSRERLRQLYGDEGRLDLHSIGEPGAITGARVVVLLPTAGT